VKSFFIVLCGLLVFSCTPPGPREDPPTSIFENGKRMGRVDLVLAEASGLVASRANPGFMWAHNDSRNKPEVFLIDSLGAIRMTCHINVSNRDWEDIAIGKGPDSTKWYLYIADIGDNQSIYDIKYIYRFEEPSNEQPTVFINDVDTIQVKLEGGARDTETLMIDPFTNDLIMISKWETPARVYRVPFPFTNAVLSASEIVRIDLAEVTGGDISQDGKEILLKSYNDVYYWRRSDETPLQVLLAKPPMVLLYEPEFQGEAIAWSLDGKGYFTLSEGKASRRAHLMYYKRVE
jgi:hypothetical protein